MELAPGTSLRSALTRLAARATLSCNAGEGKAWARAGSCPLARIAGEGARRAGEGAAQRAAYGRDVG
jgi:hypothetical protein